MEDQRVLIVEDCYLMADATHDILTAAGTTVMDDRGLADRSRLRRSQFGMRDQLSTSRRTTSRGIPIVFVTAYDANMPQAIHCARPLVSKPVDSFRIGAGLRNRFQL